MSKIHIIYPDIETGYYPNIHHGMAFLAGAVRNAGHDFSFHHVVEDEAADIVAERALNEKPDVIGFSLCHNQRMYAHEYIKALRRKGCEALLVVGGIYPTTDPEDVFQYLDVDAAAIGEAEGTLIAMLGSLKGGVQKRNVFTEGNEACQAVGKGSEVKETKGFYFRGDDGEIIKNKIPSLDPDLTNLPLPDYSVFNLEKIVGDSGGWMNMMIIRGCPYNCHYCCNSILMNLYPDKKDYFRIPPIDYAIKLIKHNLGYYEDVRGVGFDDDLLCLKGDWFQEFAEKYKREIDLPYTMNARVETLTDKTIAAMKSSGCRIVNIGVESGNAEVREKILNRSYSNEQLVDVFQKLHSSGIQTSTFNMMGLPFETKEQMLDTLNINRKLKPYRGACFYFFPYPKTRLYEICKENDLFKEGFEDLTGYFSQPAIRLTECSEKDAVRICSRLRLYLYLRRLMISLRIEPAGEVFYFLMLPFAGVISKLIAGDSGFKRFVRRFVYKTSVEQG